MSIEEKLKRFDPATSGAYDPGQIIILFEGRTYAAANKKMPYYQSYWLSTKSWLRWPSIWSTDLDPGMLRLVYYSSDGTEHYKDEPLHYAMALKAGFDFLCEQGCRPMLLGWSGENPYPMIGGSEPPPEPKKPKPRVVTSVGGICSGHGAPGTPHDRVMAIIQKEEEREAEARRVEVEEVGKGELAV